MSEISFPNESEDYRLARQALLKAESDLRYRIEQVAAMRRALPCGGPVPSDISLIDQDGDARSFATLFGDHNTLYLYSFMFADHMDAPCPMCVSFLDSLDGTLRHLNERASLFVVVKRDLGDVMKLAEARGWKHLRFLSSKGSDYNALYFGETGDGSQLPMMNVFKRDGGQITHSWGSEILFAPSDTHPRHLDLFWPLWNLLDLTPERREDWMPRITD